MSQICIDSQNAFLIDSNKIDEFVQYSTQICQMQEELQAWFAREEKLKDYRYSLQGNVKYLLQSEIQKLKENNEIKTKEEKENLQKYENKIHQMECSMPKTESNNENDEILKVKFEKEKLEQLYEQQKLDRMKEILLFEKEATFYLAAIRNKNKYYIIIDKMKKSIEEGYDNYENATYDGLRLQMENPQKCYICPQCCNDFYSNPEDNYYITFITCPFCNFEFCTRCYCTRQEHYYAGYFNDEDLCCLYNDYNCIESKQVSFFIWPMSFHKRKIYSAWKKLSEQYFNQKEKYDKMHFDFMIKKDETENETKNDRPRMVSLEKLCVRTRIARVMLRDIQDRKEVKEETLKILKIALLAQSIITSAYPTLFYMINDPIKLNSLEKALQSLTNEINPFIELLYHPEHSSSKELQQISQSIQKLINDIELFSHDGQN